MVDSDRQTNKRVCENLREKEKKMKKRNKNELTLSEILIGQSCSLRY